MFERFTSEARAAVVRAQSEARALRADEIRPVHLLLGIADGTGRGGAPLRAAGAGHDRLRTAAARSGDPLDADALAALGVDLSRVRAAAEAAFGPGALDPPRRAGGHIPFTDGSKRSLELALRHVLGLDGRRGRRIDDGHVLYGVLAVEDPVVAAVLREVGVEPGELRRRLTRESDAA